MELRRFAQTVLLSPSVDDKLTAPGRLSDTAPGGAFVCPPTPARSPDLAFGKGTRRRIPSPAALRTQADRAAVLHAMANHELLALELFATALLRFPDAPAALRASWGATMRDEQRHLAAYRARLEALGGALGGLPLSSFFWDVLADCADPLAFVAGMELGLEQANLDFAGVWGRAFDRLGDRATAAVLQEVYEDEIRHVRVGVRWLRRLKDPGHSDWDAWTGALRFPMTPGRARAAVLDEEARCRAGLDRDFIARLAVARPSRGRTPRVWRLDPGVEDRVAGRAQPGDVRADLAVLPALIAAQGDVVVAPAPATALRTRWVAAGLPALTFADDPGPGAPVVLPGGRAVHPTPWGTAPGDAGWSDALRPLYDKTWAAAQLARITSGPGPWSLEDVGVKCTDMAAVRAAAAVGRCWIKAGLSTAGQHRIRTDGALSLAHERWVARALSAGPLLVEPALPVVAEVSAHVHIDADGVSFSGLVRFGARGGAFRGAWVGRWTAGLSPPLRRWLAEERIVDRLRDVALDIGERARARGLRGPLGIDAMVLSAGDGFRLRPLSEVNPRWTMGRIALRLARRWRGAWLFLPIRVLERAGYAGAPAFIAAATASCPEALPTNDPQTSQRLQTLFVPGTTLAQAADRVWAIAQTAPNDPAPLLASTAWLSSPCRPRSPRT